MMSGDLHLAGLLRYLEKAQADISTGNACGSDSELKQFCIFREYLGKVKFVLEYAGAVDSET